MSLTPGSHIGPYDIVAPLGRGGMGEVYRARDTRLNRDVAIKVLPAAVAADHERLARFTREAQTLAALNHPNIAAIYGVEVYDGTSRALIMELVEGEDLSKVIDRHGHSAPAAPRDDALPIAKQIAEALEAAHELGIVHRDLKPANVKVRADGTVKVLDFGLAKALGADGAASTANPSDSPTLTSPATMMGMVLGTAAYMAPEQARGRSVDRRADIWSFGVVLFEMLTGRRLFDGDDVSVTLAGVLKDEPEWSRLPASTPAALQQLLRRCLMKDPKQRLQSIGEARILLEGLMSGSVPMVPASFAGAGRHPRVSVVPWAVAAGAVAALAITLVLWGPWRAPAAATTGPVRVSITMPSELRIRAFRMLPDGGSLVLLGSSRKDDAAGSRVDRLYLRPLNTYEATPIPGTEGALNFSLSLDGRWLAVLVEAANDPGDRRLMKVPVDGSAPPVLLAHWQSTWPTSVSWMADGNLVTWVPQPNGQAVLRIPGGGGGPAAPVPFQKAAGSQVSSIGRALPGGAGVFAQVDSFGPRGYQTNVALLDPATGALSPIIDDAADATYVESGHIVFSRGDTVLATAFDLQGRAVSGNVTALEAGLATVAGPAQFDLTANGSLAYQPARANQYGRSLVVVDADGRVTPFIPQTAAFVLTPSLHPEGTQALVTVLNPTATYELWLADSSRASLRRVVAFPSADASNAIWSPDRQSVAYVREGLTDSDGIYIQRLDGTIEPRRIVGGFKDAFFQPKSWLPDGSGLIVTRGVAGASRDLFLVDVARAGAPLAPRPLRATPHEDDDGVVSTDGRLIAFSSNESGRKEMYVAIYDNGKVGMPIVVSDGVCGRAQWAGPRRLVYCATPGVLKSVEMTAGATLVASTPVTLHDLRKLRISNSVWTLRADGSVLALQRSEAEETLESINVVLGWRDDVERRLAGPKR